MFDRLALPRVLPFFTYLFFILIADVLIWAGYAQEQLRYLYVVKIGVVLALLWIYRRHYTELAWPGPALMGWRAIVWAVLAGIVVLVLWLNLGASWMVIGESAGFDPRSGNGYDWPLLVARIAGAALVVPVMEELFWRSFLLRWLQSPNFLAVEPSLLRFRYILMTAILFGFEHNLWFAGILAGLAYGWLYVRFRTLWSAIIAHGVTNGLLGVWVLMTGQWAYW